MAKNANFCKIGEIPRCRVSYWKTDIYEGSQRNFTLTQKITKKTDQSALKNDSFPIGKLTFLTGGRIHDFFCKKNDSFTI